MLMGKAIQTSPNVFHCIASVDQIGESEIMEIKNLMNKENATTRICLHPNVEEKVHISIICTSSRLNNRRHLHPVKHEFIVPIEGSAELKYFDSNGHCTSSKKMESGKTNIHKIPKGTIHAFVVKTNFFIFWEICEGPFSNDSTVYVE